MKDMKPEDIKFKAEDELEKLEKARKAKEAQAAQAASNMQKQFDDELDEALEQEKRRHEGRTIKMVVQDKLRAEIREAARPIVADAAAELSRLFKRTVRPREFDDAINSEGLLQDLSKMNK